MAAHTETNGEALDEKPKLAKKPVQLHPDTIILMNRVKEKTGFTNDQVIRAGLMKLDLALGDHREETPEQRLNRLVFGPQADG